MGEQTAFERLVKDFKRKTHKIYSAEEKIRIVLDGLRGEMSILELRTTMKNSDVTDTLELALEASGCSDKQTRPRLLSDNGASCISGELGG